VRPEGLGKFKNLPHLVPNQRPSGLYHSALTTTLPRTPSPEGINLFLSEEWNLLISETKLPSNGIYITRRDVLETI
jgi:hypothetical protein